MKNYSNVILNLIREVKEPEKKAKVDAVIDAYIREDYARIDELLIEMTNEYRLLERLIEKLKGKSAYVNLKKLLEGKETSNEQAIISTSSLITHIGIDLKEGNAEYKGLIIDLYTKLGVLINKL
jgi:hypothetical protein